jgi:hypothetical protein
MLYSLPAAPAVNTARTPVRATVERPLFASPKKVIFFCSFLLVA